MSYNEPNYTQIPNLLLDDHLPDMSEAELRVVLVIARQTNGWHKDKDRISLSQLVEKTGMSNLGCRNGINAALKRGVIEREPVGQSFFYSLSVKPSDKTMLPSYTVDDSTVSPSYTVLCNVVTQLEPELCNDVTPQKKGIKEKEKETDFSPRDVSETGDAYMDAALSKFNDKQAKKGSSNSWQAEMNLRLPAKQRIAIVDCVGKVCGLTALMNAKEKTLIEVHDTACWLHENGYTEPAKIDDLYRLYLADEWRRVNHPRPSLDNFMKFASQQAETPNVGSAVIGQSRAVGVFTGTMENLR